MSSRAELQALLQVSDAQYNRQRQALVSLIQEESALRDELTRLAGMDVTSQEAQVDMARMRAIGTDILWQGWLSRAKTELNMKLARILAAKEHEQRKVRRAFGKVSALRQLLKEEEAKLRKELAKDALEQAVQSSLRKRFQ